MIHSQELSCEVFPLRRWQIPPSVCAQLHKCHRSVCTGSAWDGRAGVRGWDVMRDRDLHWWQWGLCAEEPCACSKCHQQPVGCCFVFMVWQYWRNGCASLYFCIMSFPQMPMFLFVAIEFPHFSRSIVTKEIQLYFGPVSIGTGFSWLLLFVLPNCSWSLVWVFLEKVKPSFCSSKF